MSIGILIKILISPARIWLLLLLDGWPRNLITINKRGWRRHYNILTYILVILRWRRSWWCWWCKLSLVWLFSNIGGIGGTRNNTWNWNFTWTDMLELMSSTLVGDINDVEASFVRATKLAGVHNTLWDLDLWIKEPLEVHSLILLFSDKHKATPRTYLHSPLFHSWDILLNAWSNLYHLDVRRNRRAFRIHVQKRLFKLRVR